MKPIGAGEVHVWRFSLASDAVRLARLEATLSPAEKTRADRCRFERDRRRFIVGRAIYRDVLGGYLGLPPAEVPLTSARGARPHCRLATFSHNLSHSHELGIVAVTARGEVGVDVEFLERTVDVRAVAHAALTPRERAGWENLPPASRRAAFFSVWTRKEALLKATGDRAAFEFRDLEVGLDPGGSGERLADIRARLGGEWTIATFSPAAGYGAAIAVRLLEHLHAAEALTLRLLRHDDDDGLRVGRDLPGALDLAQCRLDFVHELAGAFAKPADELLAALAQVDDHGSVGRVVCRAVGSLVVGCHGRSSNSVAIGCDSPASGDRV
jgi:4'-phosphopantetheinyl transferase